MELAEWFGECGKNTAQGVMGCQTKSMGLAFHNKDVMVFGVLNAKPRDLIYGIGSLRIQTEAAGILLAELFESPIGMVSHWGVPVAKPEID